MFQSNRFRINRRKFIQYGSLAVSTGILAACTSESAIEQSATEPADSDAAGPQALDPVTVGTSWYAQAEHGGYYQAKATGIYEEYGLDVTIRQGGPDVNGTQLLMGGVTDFQTGYSLSSLNAVREGIPLVTVAAMMQKDPQTLVVHDGVYDQLSELKAAPIRVPTAGRVAYWPWLKAEYGFTDEQLRPYDYSFATFLENEDMAQQGYITNDGYFLEKAGAEAESILLADNGWGAYAYTIDTTRRLIDENPDLVQRFVDATIAGYESYLEDPEPGNALIKAENEEQSDQLMAFSLDKFDEYGIFRSGDALDHGLGTMSQERWQRFFDKMVEAGVLPADLDFKQAYTLQFVDHPGSAT
ncbi:ABC transporter substrate-binding protein [Vasconcelosia minhoensis]|nr:ABC transporter substrate-binding protein [Romeria gracilis]